MKDVSPALIRFFGGGGFMAFGLGAIEIGNNLFHIGLDLCNPLFSLKWELKEIMLLAITDVPTLIKIVFNSLSFK